jgi:hypothetical protein
MVGDDPEARFRERFFLTGTRRNPYSGSGVPLTRQQGSPARIATTGSTYQYGTRAEIMRRLLFPIMGAALLPLYAQGLSAQILPPPIEIQGRVIDDLTGQPVSGAAVVILDTYGDRLARRVTNADGEFSAQVRHRAGVRIRAGRLGYQDVTTPVLPFDGRYYFMVEIRLSVDAVLLAPMEVVAHGERMLRSPTFSEFDRRVATGFGAYFTRAEIEEIRPVLVTDLLQRIPGIRLEGSGRAGRRTVHMARGGGVGQGGGDCPVQIFVDGRLMSRAGSGTIAIDDLVSPGVVEGIEVYRGLSTVPPEFLTPNAQCGVVAIWTRRGG